MRQLRFGSLPWTMNEAPPIGGEPAASERGGATIVVCALAVALASCCGGSPSGLSDATGDSGDLREDATTAALDLPADEPDAFADPLDIPAGQVDGKLTPPPGRTLLIIGQDLDSLAAYTDAVPVVPGGVTTYTDLSEGNAPQLLWGLRNRVNWGAGDIGAQVAVRRYRGSALVIGLYLVDLTGDGLERLAAGVHDAAVDDLGEFIRDVRRPVYVRIGYEFDGPWNHYEPDAYVAVYRHLVERWRAAEIDNVATVWQSSTSTLGTYQDRPFTDWYPGDDVVDWVGASYFVFDEAIFDALLDFAREHAKPVMIAESTPQGYDLEALTWRSPFYQSGDAVDPEPRSAEQIWSEWYRPLFDYVDANDDVIRALAYINADWNSQPMWEPDSGNGYWGDSRVQANGLILERWLNQLDEWRWVHGGSDIGAVLGLD